MPDAPTVLWWALEEVGLKSKAIKLAFNTLPNFFDLSFINSTNEDLCHSSTENLTGSWMGFKLSRTVRG